jgi:carboxypeptidase C (cathepsin A)
LGQTQDGVVSYYTGRLFVRSKSLKKPNKEEACVVMNRKLRDRDTHVDLFPNYRIGADPKESTVKDHYYYHTIDTEGKKTTHMTKYFNRQMDFVKQYKDDILKVQSILRNV